jgi:adenosylcobinamide kinase / adenosylcobinamide-phosphate guanylyltransferase
MQDDLPRASLVLGGARSGKSRHAEAMVTRLAPPWTYIATAEAFDDEMRARIAEHRARRAVGWRTLEAPLDLADALAASAETPVLVDCVTLWLTNLMLAGRDIEAATAVLENAITARKLPLVMVTNEVGLGIVPDNRLARHFRDAAGRLNQRMAACADAVLFMVAGLPMKVK